MSQADRIDFDVLLTRLMRIREGEFGIVLTNAEFVYLLQLGINEVVS